MDEWLERLNYGAESHRKVVSSRLGFAMRRLRKTLSVNPAVNGYLFRIREGSERKGMGSAFHRLCPRYNGALTPLPLRLLETAMGKPLLFLPILNYKIEQNRKHNGQLFIR